MDNQHKDLAGPFFELTGFHSKNTKLAEVCWREIKEAYMTENRHYHTLDHLSAVLEQLTVVKSGIDDWNTVLFALFYHDLVYDARRSDNEEQSAAIATKRMKGLNVPEPMVNRCTAHILATKAHDLSADNDSNLFTDADLSILGQDWQLYELYVNNVRKEYASYPDAVYNPGRKQVLLHFLGMPYIFKTDYFRQRFEFAARQNIEREMRLIDHRS